MTIIIINQRAYYILLLCCAALPSAFKPELSDRCQEFDDPKSTRIRLYIIYTYIVFYVDGCSDGGVPYSRHRVKAVGLHISRTHYANDIRLRNVVLFPRLFLSLLHRDFPSPST